MIGQHGKEIKHLLLMVMRTGGDIKYSRNPENRAAVLKAIFDYNNCIAAMGGVDFLGEAEITEAVAENNRGG